LAAYALRKTTSYKMGDVATPALDSQPKQGLAKVWAKSEARESHFMLLGMWANVKE
jgi:hypothetical protein